MLTYTYTRVHHVITSADPYKICRQCNQWITGILDKPGSAIVVPCEHESDYRDVCPSWGPVDGCQCIEHLGIREHGIPPSDVPHIDGRIW